MELFNPEVAVQSLGPLLAGLWITVLLTGIVIVLGAAPNRRAIVEWRNVRHYNCRNDSAATVNFQLVFFEGRTDFRMNYADVVFGGACAFADRGGSATVVMAKTDQSRHVLEVAFDKAVDGRPFAALRSMYVTEVNNDVARIALLEKGAKGWREELVGPSLPPAASAYVAFVAESLDVPVTLVGTGASRDAVLALQT